MIRSKEQGGLLAQKIVREKKNHLLRILQRKTCLQGEPILEQEDEKIFQGEAEDIGILQISQKLGFQELDKEWKRMG